MTRPLIVIKVGGSLYDLPDLGPRLLRWLNRPELEGHNLLLVPGGGRSADVVRDLDRIHHLGEEKAHWLALRSLTLNAHFLADLLPARLTDDPLRLGAEGRQRLWLLDVHAFAILDECCQGAGKLPHNWGVTSDSLAARAAIVGAAARLVLLKSVAIPSALDWVEAARLGFVDEMFAAVLGDTRLPVDAINFRACSE
jgi:5-(aminomethyl)-3-furanmethanol phosphate kinase